MASLAPGNGWFPHGPNTRKTGLPAKGVVGVGATNVYRFPQANSLPLAQTAISGKNAPFSKALAAALLGSGARLSGWPLLGAVIAALAWVGLVGVAFAAVVTAGVPWLTATAAFAAAHLLAAVYAALVAVRAGRTLLQMETLRQVSGERPRVNPSMSAGTRAPERASLRLR